jgi:hypothetical protein
VLEHRHGSNGLIDGKETTASLMKIYSRALNSVSANG